MATEPTTTIPAMAESSALSEKKSEVNMTPAAPLAENIAQPSQIEASEVSPETPAGVATESAIEKQAPVPASINTTEKKVETPAAPLAEDIAQPSKVETPEVPTGTPAIVATESATEKEAPMPASTSSTENKIESAAQTLAAPLAETVAQQSNIKPSEASPETPAVVATEPTIEKEAPPPTYDATEKKVDSAAQIDDKKTPDTPLAKLFAVLPTIIAEAGYYEMWGVELAGASHVPTSIVLEKFLRANGGNVENARNQLLEALKWRKSTNPAKLLTDYEFDSAKFGGLGFVTVYPKTEHHEKEIVTWNIYGNVKSNQETFGVVSEFIKWRAALMELSVKELDLASATVPIPADGIDPYRMVQVHDYLNVSFLRMDPAVKAASKEVIRIFAMAYPELLKEKFFVNVPRLMGWLFAAMKLFVARETISKFHPLAYGGGLAAECKGWGEKLPEAYGGKGADVTLGMTPKYTTTPSLESATVGEQAK